MDQLPIAFGAASLAMHLHSAARFAEHDVTADQSVLLATLRPRIPTQSISDGLFNFGAFGNRSLTLGIFLIIGLAGLRMLFQSFGSNPMISQNL